MSTYQRILDSAKRPRLKNVLQIDTVDLHTGGEPLRVVLNGYPELKGNSVLEYRRFLRDEHDHLRKFLMFEPRGHADMYGCVITPPNDEGADFGVVFIHNEGYSTMCGHAVIALGTLAVQFGWIDVHDGNNLLNIDAPCGRIGVSVSVRSGKVIGVRFTGVPSFVVGLDRRVDVAGLGPVRYDLAYGGAFYAYVDLERNQLGLNLDQEYYQTLIRFGMDIKGAVMQNDADIVHPLEPDLSFLYGTIFVNKSEKKGIDSRNVCVFAEGEVDRCPTGSGVSGRMAIHRARNELALKENMIIESITGSTFKASAWEEVDFGPYRAVIPEVEGTAFITGMHTFILDPTDPIKTGFIFR